MTTQPQVATQNKSIPELNDQIKLLALLTATQGSKIEENRPKKPKTITTSDKKRPVFPKMLKKNPR